MCSTKKTASVLYGADNKTKGCNHTMTKEKAIVIKAVDAAIDIEKIIDTLSDIGMSIEPNENKNGIGNRLYKAQNTMFNIIETYVGNANDMLFDDIVNFIEEKADNGSDETEISEFIDELKKKYEVL